MIFRSARLTAQELRRATGWELRSEGLCRADRCVPFAAGSTASIDLSEVARALRMPIVEEPRAGAWALGPEVGGAAVETAALPEIELPDLEGRPFRLASLRGTKVLLVGWASW